MSDNEKVENIILWEIRENRKQIDKVKTQLNTFKVKVYSMSALITAVVNFITWKVK